MTITMRDVLMMAAPIAGGFIVNPRNENPQCNKYCATEAFREAILVVKQALEEEGINIATDPFQEAVVDAANKG